MYTFVSIVNFEHVITGWVPSLKQKIKNFLLFWGESKREHLRGEYLDQNDFFG